MDDSDGPEFGEDFHLHLTDSENEEVIFMNPYCTLKLVIRASPFIFNLPIFWSAGM